MKRLMVLLASLALVMFLTAGCSGSTPGGTAGGAAAPSAAVTTCPTHASGFAKTKFLAHAALGFGAFHRYIYKPYRAGTFRSGAHGRIRAFIKAALAALFVKREIRLAAVAAQKSPALCKLIVSPLRTVSETVQSAVSKLKGGDASGIRTLENAITQVKSQASSQGSSIAENTSAPLG